MHKKNLIFLILIILLVVLILKRKENFVNNTNLNKPKNVIMTTYFCNKKDPQRNKKAECNKYEYIKPWYDSVKKLNLNGIIFHDGMSEKFINKYQTDKIKFVYVNSSQFKYSLNDQRFLIYHDYILKNKNIENIFMTDGNDVTIVNTPFNKFKGICVGSELGNLNKNSWIRNKSKNFNNNKYHFESNNEGLIYNAGILGGNRKEVLHFLSNMKTVFYNLNEQQKKQNLNMIVFNYVVYNILNKKVITGGKLHSKFKKYENHRKDVCFIHK